MDISVDFFFWHYIGTFLLIESNGEFRAGGKKGFRGVAVD